MLSGKPLLSRLADNGDADSFAIDGTSGQLTTATDADLDLDYETQRDYEVKVTVSDGIGEDGRNDSTADNTIRVIIRLTNDRTDDAAVVNRAPYFNRNEGDGLLTERTVPENTPKDMNIGDVLGATDDDAGDDLTFAFATEDNEDAAKFTIDPGYRPVDNQGRSDL